MAKELFNAWDSQRLGYLLFDDLAGNLIAIGLAMSKLQVMRLMQLLTQKKGSSNGQAKV